MRSKLVVPFFASLALCASAAMAQDAPQAPPAPAAGQMGPGPMHMSKEDMAKHHARMCIDGYAHAVGELATLEAKLALAGEQKPLFESWKKVKLASAKARADECAVMKMPEKDASIVEHLKLEEKMLNSRLADLRAELPALEALAGSLNDEQKHAFGHRHMHGPFGGEGPMGGEHGMDGHGNGPGAGPGPGPDGDAPPPPEQ